MRSVTVKVRPKRVHPSSTWVLHLAYWYPDDDGIRFDRITCDDLGVGLTTALVDHFPNTTIHYTKLRSVETIQLPDRIPA